GNFSRWVVTMVAILNKLLAKFRETGSVLDLQKCGHMKTVTNEETSVAVLASFSKTTHKWHPYKHQLLQHLNEDDPDRRTEFAEWAKQKLEQDPQFTQKILFSDEANFYVNGEVNKQNHRYWSDTNPHWIDPSKTVGRKKLIVWCGIWGTKIVGPFFINGNLKATGYAKLLHDDVFPSLCTEAGTFPVFFQQDGAPSHYGCQVRIGRRGPVEWPPRSPDLTPLDFYLWGHLKAIVYAVKIRDVQHLKLWILEACASISPAVLLSVCEVGEEGCIDNPTQWAAH
uniref:Tc1-like transposase DDE domain-containing protein n=1 Tax=Xenopus tropicalis TaxID=8364 RepID=A0A803JU31_XENTR